MKKYFTFIAGILLSVFLSNAQTVIYDGETITPDFWDLGGGFGATYSEGPNGADCHQGEGWKLYVSGKMDIMTEGIANPLVSDVNPTEKVVRFVRAKNGEGWAGAGLDISSRNIKDNNINKFSILVKKSMEGNVTMKLEGNGVFAQQQTQLYNTPGQWQRLTFTFDSPSFSNNPATLLVFPHDQGGLTETIVTYWDEVTMYSAIDEATVIYNGNDPIGTPGFIDGYWGPNGSLSDLETDVFPNFDKSGINSSDHVIRFIRAKDGRNFCGMGLGGQNINVTTAITFSLMINKVVSGRVGMKLEGAGSQEVYADYTTPGQWAKLYFTFDPAQFTGNPNTIIIFPHFEETDLSGQNLIYHTPMYIDNVVMNDTVTGVNSPNQNRLPVSSKFFDLTGNYLGTEKSILPNGIFIVKTLFDNGTEENRKLINRK
ncbi:MAG: hypothetical protein WCL70_00815 [Paludibacter sp.]